MSNVRRFSLVVAALATCAAMATGAQASWAPASFTLPTTDSQLTAASCVSTSFCVLTGVQTGGSPRGLTYKYNGSTYSSVALATATAEPYGVHCATTTFCMAVGTDFAAATPTAHAEKFNGTSWSNVTAASPSGSTFTELRGVSCVNTSSCYAAGRHQTTATTNRPLVETFNGTSFSLVTVTPPAGTTTAELNDIACTATNACTAVGFYDTESPRAPLIFRYNGTTWATQSASLPAGATDAELNSVACPTSTICHAVGSYEDGSGTFHALAQSWNGTSWTNRAVADPSGGQNASLADISCYSSTGCVAVGSYTNTTNLNVEKLAAGWNGSAWSLQTDSRPTGVSDAQLNGVGCVSSTFCRAVGVSVYDGTTGVTGPRAAIDAGP
jgi:hypothetical protein